MAKLEELEMGAHRGQLNADLRRLVDKYRAIFSWDVPEIDEAVSERLIIDSLRQALDDIEQQAAATRR